MKNKITIYYDFISYELGDTGNINEAKIKLDRWIKESENILKSVLSISDINHSSDIGSIYKDKMGEDDGDEVNAYRKIDIETSFNTTVEITNEVLSVLYKKVYDIWEGHDEAIVWGYSHTIFVNDKMILI